MNIWLINHYAVPPKYYPLARQTYFAKRLQALGHTVTIFAASTVHNSDINLITDKSPYKEEIIEGVRYVYIRCKHYKGNGGKRILNMCEFARKLPKVCKRYSPPDAIVATSMPPMSCKTGIQLARKYKCKAIAEIADLWPESLIAYKVAGKYNPIVLWLRRMEKWIYKKADTVVFTMENAYEYIQRQGWDKEIPFSKIRYINNGVDLEAFEKNKDKFSIEDEDLKNEDLFKVVYTGSIREVNNLGLLLDVAKEVRNDKIKFLIWGDGTEKKFLEQRVKDENIQNVVFKGRVEKKYVPSIVSQANLNYAHNSPSPLFEYGISFNKVFDYMAAGKPILCDFPCGANPVTMHNAGFSVDEPTVQNVAREIERIATMSEEEYKAICTNVEQAAKQYDFKILTRKLLDVLEQ